MSEHRHTHAGHSHVDARALTSSPGNRRALRLVILVISAFVVFEIVGGFGFHSVALLSDAVHVLTDLSAYGLALGASWLASRPPTPDRTYGYGRAEVLAALVNAAVLVAAGAWIVVHAVERLAHPHHVDGWGVAGVAAIGIVANLAGAGILMRADRGNLNVRGALLHTLTDAISSGGVLIGGVLVELTGFTRIDPIIAILVTFLIVVAGARLLRESVDVLLDATPAGIDTEQVAAAMLAHDHVAEAHDLHIWTMGAGTASLSAHLRIADGADPEVVVMELQSVLLRRFGIGHTTLQTFPDGSGLPVEAAPQLAPQDAIEWAAEHIARAHPELSRSVVHAATGAAALEFGNPPRLSPVALSVRALRILGHRADHLPAGPAAEGSGHGHQH